MRIQSKLPSVGTTIFTKMSALANQYDAVNLSQGFPDFEVDSELIELVQSHMRKGNNQYAPMTGAPALRNAIGSKIAKLYNVNLDCDEEIVVTAGATQAIFTAISAFVKKDDEVIVFTPAYDCYDPAIELNGGRTVFVKLKSRDFNFTKTVLPPFLSLIHI